MTTMTKTKIGIVGCGNISGAYLKIAQTFDILETVACADAIPDLAAAKAAEYGVPKVCSADELLADPDIDIVVNLTPPAAHAEIALKALQAGKSVYNEKPLAIRREDAQRMLQLAKERKLLVGCAPDTFMGAGLQTCRKLIDDGAIGRPLAATAFMLGRGPEPWHPNPEFYYQAGGGPMFDMGPYYLTALVALLGPVKRATGSAVISYPERTIGSGPKKGKHIQVEIPTHIAGVLDFAGGAVGTLITSFDVWAHQLPRIEIYGSEGTLSAPGPEHVRRAGEDVEAGDQSVGGCAAAAAAGGEQPQPGRRRHGLRAALGPAAPGQRGAGVPRARRHAHHPRRVARGAAHRAGQHVRAAGAAAAGPAAQRPGRVDMPATVRAAQALFFANAAIWLVIGAATLARMNAGLNRMAALIVAALMAANAGAMLVAGIGIGRRRRLFYFFAMAVLAVNIVLTFTDEFGLLDLATLLIDLVLLGLLVASRAEYRAGS